MSYVDAILKGAQSTPSQPSQPSQQPQPSQLSLDDTMRVALDSSRYMGHTAPADLYTAPADLRTDPADLYADNSMPSLDLGMDDSGDDDDLAEEELLRAMQTQSPQPPPQTGSADDTPQDYMSSLSDDNSEADSSSLFSGNKKTYAILVIVGVVVLTVICMILKGVIDGSSGQKGTQTTNAANAASAAQSTAQNTAGTAARFSNTYITPTDTVRYVDSMQITKYFEVSDGECHFYITGLASAAKQKVKIEVTLDEYNTHVDGEILHVLYNTLMLGDKSYLINFELLKET